MKKLFAILSALGLSATAGSTVVSCGTSDKSEKVSDDAITAVKEMLKGQAATAKSLDEVNKNLTAFLKSVKESEHGNDEAENKGIDKAKEMFADVASITAIDKKDATNKGDVTVTFNAVKNVKFENGTFDVEKAYIAGDTPAPDKVEDITTLLKDVKVIVANADKTDGVTNETGEKLLAAIDTILKPNGAKAGTNYTVKKGDVDVAKTTTFAKDDKITVTAVENDKLVTGTIDIIATQVAA